MKVTVRVHPSAPAERAEVGDERTIQVWIKAKPVEGEANKALITFLRKVIKKRTGTSPQISIVSGGKSRLKILEVDCSWQTVKDAISVRINSSRAFKTQ
jgi:uncharacterized protein (TIGR00251 family)